MLLIVGLGNEGVEYQSNRHNLGFLIVDYLVKKYNLVKINNKLKCSLYKGSIFDYSVILSKPKTMMNLSGESIRLIKNFYKINQNDIFVFHDELDLDLAKVKFKIGGGSAGHNGIRNIDKNIGNNYYRIRVGIKGPVNNRVPEKFVLSDFNDKEKKELNKKFEVINENIKYILNKEINNFMNVINK
jgi:PTH1 family peptidyl-tRNA hydrolase